MLVFTGFVSDQGRSVEHIIARKPGKGFGKQKRHRSRPVIQTTALSAAPGEWVARPLTSCIIWGSYSV